MARFEGEFQTTVSLPRQLSQSLIELAPSTRRFWPFILTVYTDARCDRVGHA